MTLIWATLLEDAAKVLLQLVGEGGEGVATGSGVGLAHWEQRLPGGLEGGGAGVEGDQSFVDVGLGGLGDTLQRALQLGGQVGGLPGLGGVLGVGEGGGAWQARSAGLAGGAAARSGGRSSSSSSGRCQVWAGPSRAGRRRRCRGARVGVGDGDGRGSSGGLLLLRLLELVVLGGEQVEILHQQQVLLPELSNGDLGVHQGVCQGEDIGGRSDVATTVAGSRCEVVGRARAGQLLLALVDDGARDVADLPELGLSERAFTAGWPGVAAVLAVVRRSASAAVVVGSAAVGLKRGVGVLALW